MFYIRRLALVLFISLSASSIIPISSAQQPHSTPSINEPLHAQNVALVTRLGGHLAGISIQDKYGFISRGDDLAVFELSNPTQVIMVNQIPLPSGTRTFKLAGSYLYIAAGKQGLRILDISDPKAPRTVGSYTPHSPSPWEQYAVDNVWVMGNYLVLQVSYKDIEILDITRPQQPIKVGAYHDYSWIITGAYVAGSYLYVNSSTIIGRIEILDLSDPHHPTHVGSYISMGWSIRSSMVVGQFAYITTVTISPYPDGELHHELQIVDISAPSHPTRVSTYDLGPNSKITSNEIIAVAANKIYINTQYKSTDIIVIDITNPAVPAAIDHYAIPDAMAGATLNTHTLYLLARDQYGQTTLRTIDTAHPDRLIETSRVTLAWFDRVYHIITDGQQALITTGSFSEETMQLRIMNISNPETITQIGFYDTQTTITGIFVVGKHVYLTTSSGSMRVIDLTNPSAPVEVGHYIRPLTSLKLLHVDDHYVYLHTNNYAMDAPAASSIRMIDITNPANPTEVGAYHISSPFLYAAINGQYAYVGIPYGEPKLSVIDLSNPAKPIEVGAYPLSAAANYNILVADQYAYIPTASSETLVLDVSDRAHPREVGVYRPVRAKWFTPLVASQGRLYGRDDQGLSIVDVSHPTKPFEVGHYEMSWGPASTSVADKLIYVGGWNLSVLRYTGEVIGGQIRQANGLPVANVLLTTSSGITTTSSTDGSYRFQEMPRATVIITPNLTNYAFWPPYRTVTLPPNVEDQHFVILPRPVSATLEISATGTLAYSDTQGLKTELLFPAHTFSHTTTVVLTPTVEYATTGWSSAAHAFELATYNSGGVLSDVVMAHPVSVTVNYSDMDVRVISDTNRLSLAWWNGQAWQDTAQVCGTSTIHDPIKRRLHTAICRSGRYSLIGPSYQVYIPLVSHR